jgi:hypothetical protein
MFCLLLFACASAQESACIPRIDMQNLCCHIIPPINQTQFALSLPLCPSYLQESAYPGFGARLLMKDHDHISLCKPEGRGAPAYQVVANMLREVLEETRSSAA